MGISLSESAARWINKAVAEAGNNTQGVRLEVLGGGCSGYKYKFSFAQDANAAEDIIVDRDGAKLIVDKESLQFLDGSELDYAESLTESGFQIVNPNAASSCGCGSSFSAKKS